MAKKKETQVLVAEAAPEMVRLENLVECIQQVLFEFNELLVELNEDFEGVAFDLFDENGDLVATPKTIAISKTWSM